MPAAATARKAARPETRRASIATGRRANVGVGPRAAALSRAAIAAPGAAGHLIPVAVGRTAVAVRRLPDSGFVHRLTRGRAWIAVLGLLLIGIVALNVATLGFDASISKMERQALDLEQKNSALRAGLAQKLSHDRVEATALSLGLVRPATDEYTYRQAGEAGAALAADRVAAATVNESYTGAEIPVEPVE